jgi:hypothetical protein
MAVNESRSCNQDLRRGARDGKFKSLTPSRGGEVDPTAATIRKAELNIQYNVQVPSMDLPEAHLG